MSTDLVQTGGALAIRPDQTVWTPEQGAVLRQAGIGEDVANAELAAFLHLCQRTGLDPFSRQIYLIGRFDKKKKRTVYTPQTGIDGYRVVAHRATAQTGGTYGYEDTVWCDQAGRWRDVWLANEPPAAAKVTVLRDGQRFSAVARFSEYAQTYPDGNPSGLWGKMPAGQIAKCAEALALRKAFPHDLAGVYTAEEMDQADQPVPERHLRRVEQGEGDPWATPAPDSDTTSVKGRSKPAQDHADAAGTTNDQAAVKEIYRLANTAGLLAETVKTPDRELIELGAYLIVRGQQLAVPAIGEDEDIPDGETVEEPAPSPAEDVEAANAERELRAAAARAGLDTVEADFERSYGLPIGLAKAEQLREMTSILTGTAA